jgi:hypothetical protein
MHSKGEKVTAKAHGGPIDVTGITVATVDEAVRLQEVNTYFDPVEMFRQIAPNGIVNKQIVDKKIDRSTALDLEVPSHDGVKIAKEHNSTREGEAGSTDRPSQADTCPVSGASMSAALSSGCPVMSALRPNSTSSPDSEWVKVSSSSKELPRSDYSSSVTGNVEDRMAASNKIDYEKKAGVHDEVDQHLESSADKVHPHPHTMERAIEPSAGDAVVVGPKAEETILAHREMSSITKDEEPLLLNRE